MAVAAASSCRTRRLVRIVLLLTLVGAAPAEPEPVAPGVLDGQHAYNRGDFTRAYAIWSGLASQGDDQAAMDLAAMLDQGDGVPRDSVAALRWYGVAAEHGSPEAEFDVGVMLDSGRAAGRDVANAAVWYGRAAAHGQRRAQYNLGQLYDAGEGVPHNPDAARTWYRLAATNGVLAAVSKLVPDSAAARTAAPAELVQAIPQAPPTDAQLSARPAHGEVEFVWAAPSQSVPVMYFVEVDALTSQGSRPAASRYVAETAVALDLGAAPGDFAWRVYVVDPKRQHYAIGGWQRFSIKPAASAG